MLVQIFVCHVILLGSGFYDSKVKNYPQMERVELPGPKVPLTEVMAAEPKVAVWQAACEAWDQAGILHSDQQILAMLEGKENRDEAAITRWQENQRLGMDALRALLDRSGDQLWTWPMPKEANSELLEYGDSTKILKLANVIRFPCRLTAKSPAQCVDAAILGNRLCARLRACDTVLIANLVTSTIHTKIDRAALVATRSCVLAKDATRLEQLAGCYPEGYAADRQTSLANTLRGEFRFGCQYLIWSRENVLKTSPYRDVLRGNIMSTLDIYWMFLRIQPNRYAAEHADRIEALIRRLPIPLAQHPPEPEKKMPSPWRQFDPSPQAGMTDYEVMGGGNSHYIKAIQITARQIAHNALCRTVIAIARYRLAHNGALPASLGELVPAYLPAIPQDPIDAKPLRYDAARGRLWSIGMDCKDDGGADTIPTEDGIPGDLIVLDALDMIIDLNALFTAP